MLYMSNPKRQARNVYKSAYSSGFDSFMVTIDVCTGDINKDPSITFGNSTNCKQN